MATPNHAYLYSLIVIYTILMEISHCLYINTSIFIYFVELLCAILGALAVCQP